MEGCTSGAARTVRLHHTLTILAGIAPTFSARSEEWNQMVTLADIREAQARILGIAVRTPLLESQIHQDGTDADSRVLYLKPENQQPIGAFKLRGAYNKIASLSKEDRQRGVITYSSGNHAQGVAYAARALGMKAVITMPTTAPSVKLQATAALGAEIVLAGTTGVERQIKAEELSAQHGYVIIPPFNDEKIIAGQGTIGIEILEDLPDVETVLVPVGGGGLISGIATAIKLTNPSVKVIGVEPELGADAQASLRAGKIVELPGEQVTRTMADGLRAQYVGEINFEHIRLYVDDIVSVSEQEIEEATRKLAADPKTTAEPSGAVTVAAFLFHKDQLPQTKVNVAVISGGNIDPALLARLRS
ncbi:MAG TPA: threonine/serine dehydratase [Terriglobales bacterium]|jgi:threonine dehydratase|nr:threonine/serine dehydratase [Terriglobales bacterium]